MPVNQELAHKIWNRYSWCRDNGHSEYVEKADKCDRFFCGDQWDSLDLAVLRAARRPALTINKILSTTSNVMGEQINNRSEITFRPRSAVSENLSDILAKVFKQISDNNKLDWLRSDVFADGIITSRGFFDVRLAFDDHMQGEVKVGALNPKNVIPDPDADEYDPDTWADVFTTKWVTADDIAVLYSQEDAEYLRRRDQSFFPYGYDSINTYRDRFGDRYAPQYHGDYDHTSVQRNIRLIERQYRALDKQKHFLSLTGDTRPVPEGFDRNKIALFVDQFGYRVIDKLVRRIRWTVIADQVVLHDDWSPYKHFTVVPYFPYFRHGRTIGFVENLIGSQELLNKVSSQELHVVNTTANSGYKVKTGSLTNMTPEELEQKGAQSGIVIEVDEIENVEKIQPNNIPQGLDRISYKAEEHIKTISGVPDSMMGNDRADVAAKAIQAKKQSAVTNLVKPFDNLTRTDHLLARNILDLVQNFYTEERIGVIVKDQMTGEMEQFQMNAVQADGTIINDLTSGEYDVVVSTVNLRETMEDSQFEQALALRELGVPIDDTVLVENSRLRDKKRIVEQMNAAKSSPEAQAAADRAARAEEAEVGKIDAEAKNKLADADLKSVKAVKEGVLAEKEANTPPETQGDTSGVDLIATEAKIDLEERKFEHEKQMDFMEHGLKRNESQAKIQQQAIDSAAQRAQQRTNAAEANSRAVHRPKSGS